MSSSCRILIVDDSPLDAELILQALIENNVCSQAVHVRDGAQALDFLHARGRFVGRTGAQPELMFLDLNMPQMDGMEVLRQIRGDHRFDAMEVIMFTGSREELDATRGQALGVSLFLEKPVDYDQYLETVKSVVARKLSR